MPQGRITAGWIAARKRKGERVACLTCYDYPMARLLDEAGTDLILVGDSVGNTVLGYESTLPVSLDEMLHHTRAVVRGTERTHICLDLPFMSYQVSTAQAVAAAGRAVKEGGAQSVKLEGGAAVLENPRRGNSVDELLRYVHYEPQALMSLYRDKVAAAELPESLAETFIETLAAGLEGYTYLEP